jgi:hypothetical protein
MTNACEITCALLQIIVPPYSLEHLPNPRRSLETNKDVIAA